MMGAKGLASLCLGVAIAPVIQAQSWELSWADEFEYTGLPDSLLWTYDVGGGGWGNNELQYYTEKRTENARVDGTALIIEAHKESGYSRDYTSARLVSKGNGDWTYGRIEVRAKLPTGRGTWPAIWMLPTESRYGNGRWPDTGEIDIMEHVGYNANTVHATVHTDRYNHQNNTQRGGQIRISDATETFHDYVAEWSPQLIKFSVDGSVFFRFHNEGTGWPTWPFDQPFHLLLNIAVGGSWGGLRGVDDSIFPQQLVIDHVRVYRYVGLPDVSISAPPALQTGQRLDIAADASDSDGSVTRLLIFQGDGLLASFEAPPYSLAIDDVHAGCYTLHAQAVDNGGWSAESDTLALKVGDDCGQAPYLIAPHGIPGHIEAEYYDLGGPGIAYSDLTPSNDNAAIRTDEGVDVDYTTDGKGYDVAGITRREWLEYTVEVAESGLYTLDARMATSAPTASLSIQFDGEDVTSPVVFENASNRMRWSTVTRSGIVLDAGVHRMRIRMLEAGFRVNWLRFTLDSPLSSEPGPQPDEIALLGNYPNPFAESTRIVYSVNAHGPVTLEVYNALGRHILTLVDGQHARGTYDSTLSGHNLSSGVYFFRLTSRESSRTRPILLVRQ